MVLNISVKLPHPVYTSLGVILGAFAKLREVTISYVTSVRPKGTTRLPLDGFSLNFIFRYFSKICGKKKLKILLKSDKNNGHFTWRQKYIYNEISLDSSQNENVSDKCYIENQNTRFIVYFLLGISPASMYNMPTFRNHVSVPSSKAGSRLTHGSETSAYYTLTPGKYPKENIQYSNHGESLKSTTHVLCSVTFFFYIFSKIVPYIRCGGKIQGEHKNTH